MQIRAEPVEHGPMLAAAMQTRVMEGVEVEAAVAQASAGEQSGAGGVPGGTGWQPSSPLQLNGRGTARALRCRVLQSPLAGVSDRIFRGLVRRWAPDALLFTEMVNATSLELGHGRIKVEELASEAGPIAVQLFDHRPEALAEAARRAEAAGAFLIDINMGCPVRKIARKGGGSGLIRDPDLAARLVEAVASAVALPVTVKTRLAWCGAAESAAEDGGVADGGAADSGAAEKGAAEGAAATPGVTTSAVTTAGVTPAAIAWCRRLESAGARLLTLHGRTRAQGFRGQADWGAIAAVKASLQIPLIANGDIHSPADALHCLRITGADGVMVGRGTMGAPWLVGQIDAALSGRAVPPAPDALGRICLAAEQLQALVQARGDHGLLIARKHMGWTCTGFAGAPQLRHALMRAPTPADALALLQQAAEPLGGLGALG
ncbi:MAG: tRNA dihydrouridine synthase [Cyanobium sp.]